MGGRCFFITPWLEGSGSLAVQPLFPFLPLSLSFSSSSSSLSLLVFLTCSSYTYTRQRSALTLSLPLPLWAACFVRDTRLKRWRGQSVDYQPSSGAAAAPSLNLLTNTSSPHRTGHSQLLFSSFQILLLGDYFLDGRHHIFPISCFRQLGCFVQFFLLINTEYVGRRTIRHNYVRMNGTVSS